MEISATSDDILSFIEISSATCVSMENLVARCGFSCSEVPPDVAKGDKIIIDTYQVQCIAHVHFVRLKQFTIGGL
nr:hypothetical protein [Tanacetum cinerariifolium]